MIGTSPGKQQRRELARWAKLLKLHAAGVSVRDLAILESITTAQVYALLARARKAKAAGWL